MTNDNPRGLPVVQRWKATGDYAYPAEEADDGEFVSYEDYAALLAEVEAMRADAARYRFCVDHAAWPVIANDGETWVMFVVVKGRRRSTFMAATATEAIDAAMAAEGRDV